MKAEKFWTMEFTVEGRGAFPFDMLRYDSCHPVSGEDAAGLDYSPAIALPATQRQVRLIMYSGIRNPKPTFGRWDSFGWRVVTVHHA